MEHRIRIITASILVVACLGACLAAALPNAAIAAPRLVWDYYAFATGGDSAPFQGSGNVTDMDSV